MTRKLERTYRIGILVSGSIETMDVEDWGRVRLFEVGATMHHITTTDRYGYGHDHYYPTCRTLIEVIDNKTV